MKQDKLSFHQIFWYMFIFSIIGLFIETVFCYITTGRLESRKGLLWGPFCPIYGVGAAILILTLNSLKSNPFKLFICGAVLGNAIEYILSYVLESIYSSRFWDYSFISNNLNGRICVTYSIFWGILAVVLIKFIKPIIDRIINKIPLNKRKVINLGITIFLIIDCIVTVWAIKTYQNRVVNIYFGKDQQVNTHQLNIINKIKYSIEENIFTNDKMRFTFPNLRFKSQDGKEYYLVDMIN